MPHREFHSSVSLARKQSGELHAHGESIFRCVTPSIVAWACGEERRSEASGANESLTMHGALIM